MIIVSIFVLSIYLPDFYWKAFEQPLHYPFVLYSPITYKFMIARFGEEGFHYVDEDGNQYNRDQYESLLPLFNFRQLLTSGKMPDSLQGKKLDPEEIRQNLFSMRIKSANYEDRKIKLFPLFESESGRVNLELPGDYFRCTGKIEFIESATNHIDYEKSRLFTAALASNGFHFPAKKVNGNPNVRKQYDAGYFLLDARNKLFHLMMVKGEPFISRVNLPQSINIKSILVREFPLKEFYGLLVTKQNEIYLLSCKDYGLIKLPLEHYLPEKHFLIFRGNLFYRIITLVSEDEIRTVVTDRKYRIVDTYHESWETKYMSAAGLAANFIFPFTIQLTDRNSNFVNLHFRFSKWNSLPGILVLLTATILITIKRKQKLQRSWLDLLIVAVTGIYGFIAILIFDPIIEN
jgi:hypothetical protein